MSARRTDREAPRRHGPGGLPRAQQRGLVLLLIIFVAYVVFRLSV